MESLETDCLELESLLGQASRPRVRTLLQAALNDLRAQLHAQQKKEQNGGNASSATIIAGKPVVSNPSAPISTVKLQNYAWDQSDKFVKIYVSLPAGVQPTNEQVTLNKTENSVDLLLKDVGGKSYSFSINGLLKEIDAEASYFKIKSTDVLLMLKKQTEKSQWAHITQVDKKMADAKTANKPKPDMDGDPSAGIMNLMKQMYDEGDDEMKRTIKKTWYESQNKKAGGGGLDDPMGGGFGGMGGLGAM